MTSTVHTRLTKAQLLDKINSLEAELGLSQDKVRELATELDAYHVTQRPSRGTRTPERPARPLTAMQQIADRRLAMATARELAMRTGRAVLV
jgi:hypothetical protein